MLCTATPDISSSSENINSAARVSRLSFRFLWLWVNKQEIKKSSTLVEAVGWYWYSYACPVFYKNNQDFLIKYKQTDKFDCKTNKSIKLASINFIHSGKSFGGQLMWWRKQHICLRCLDLSAASLYQRTK